MTILHFHKLKSVDSYMDWQPPLSSVLRTNDVYSSYRSPTRSAPLSFDTPGKSTRFSSASGLSSSTDHIEITYLNNQVSNLKLEMDNLRTMCTKLHDEVLYEFETRTSLVSKQLKEAILTMEATRLKYSGSDKKWRETIDSGVELIKLQQEHHSNLLSSSVEKITKENRQNNLVLDQLIQKCTDRISVVQAQIEKSEEGSKSLTEEMASLKKTIVGRVLAEVKKTLAAEIDISTKHNSKSIDEKWGRAYQDIQQLSKDVTIQMHKHQSTVIDTIDLHTDDLSRIKRKETEMTNRIAALETVVAENIKKIQGLTDSNARITQLYDRIAEERDAAQDHIESLKKRISQLEVQISECNKLGEDFSLSSAEQTEKINDVYSHVSKLSKDVSDVKNSTQTQIIERDDVLHSLETQLDALRQLCHNIKEQWRMGQPEAALKKNLAESNKVLMQKYATVLKNKIQNEIGEIKKQMESQRSLSNQSEILAEDKLEQLTLKIASLDLKHAELQSLVNKSIRKGSTDINTNHRDTEERGSDSSRMSTNVTPMRSYKRAFANPSTPATNSYRSPSLFHMDPRVSPDTALIKSTELQIRESRGETDRWSYTS